MGSCGSKSRGDNDVITGVKNTDVKNTVNVQKKCSRRSTGLKSGPIVVPCHMTSSDCFDGGNFHGKYTGDFGDGFDWF